MNCNYCSAPIGDRLCSRKATCRQGCEYFCWQHAKKYGGYHSTKKKICDDPYMQYCDEVSDKRRRFPCKASDFSLMFSQKELDEYWDMIGSFEYGSRKQKAIAKKRIKEWKKIYKKPSKKNISKRKVRFK